MKKTDNYSLPQWEKQDFIKMEDFNDAFGKTDAALKANADAAATGLNAEIAARGEAIAALGKNLGAAGHNARIAWGSYTGTGATDAANPNTLQFDFYPVLVLIGDTKATSAPRNPTVFLRDRIKVCADPAGGNGLLVATWSDNALSWYCRSDNAYYQLNGSGELYRYAVIGYDKAKEEA
ncbi:MAG: hypothetical protein PUI35_06395 [Oscillibacter sp.]|nr:hypothetical protein [Oscillibacter sp.]